MWQGQPSDACANLVSLAKKELDTNQWAVKNSNTRLGDFCRTIQRRLIKLDNEELNSYVLGTGTMLKNLSVAELSGGVDKKETPL